MDERLRPNVIFARLGVPPHDADFELVACDHCGRQYLADHECLRVYLDPADLSQVALNIAADPWPACRGCGRSEWDCVRASSVAPEWQWACGEARPGE
ncbi:MAG TPA: hypothetical protein VEL76_11920 [Gemmataceae bacterium]|nr:hypothetical protein [Gemmataceae bacterium]